MMKTADVAEIGSYQYHRYGIYIAQIWKYALTHLAIVVGIVIYYIFTARFITLSLLILTIIFHFLAQAVLITFAFIDPGIMRKIYPNLEHNLQQAQIPVNHLIRSGDFQKRDRRWLLTINAHVLPIKTCRTCLTYRPPRMVHCFICNACIDRFDHHCGFLGNCVGKRNYTYFFGFLVLIAIQLILVIAQTIIVMASSKWRGSGTAYLVMNIILLIYAVGFSAFVYFLLFSHFYLIGTNATTYQCLKRRWQSNAGDPYRKSCLNNYRSWLFSGLFKPRLSDPEDLVYQRGFNLENLVQSKTPQIKPSGQYPAIPSQTMLVAHKSRKNSYDLKNS